MSIGQEPAEGSQEVCFSILSGGNGTFSHNVSALFSLLACPEVPLGSVIWSVEAKV
jgi:hypothetical protein